MAGESGESIPPIAEGITSDTVKRIIKKFESQELGKQLDTDPLPHQDVDTDESRKT